MRKLKASKPAPAAPATDTAVATVAVASTDNVAERRATAREQRDNNTVAAMRYPLGNVSSRDESYTVFFFTIADGNAFTLADVLAKHPKSNPYYSGSNKSTDAGAIERQIKAGYLTRVTADTGRVTYSFTERGISIARNVLAKLNG